MPYLMPKKLSIITEWDNLRIKRKLISLWRPRLIKAVEDYVFLGRIIPRTPICKSPEALASTINSKIPSARGAR